MGTPYSTYMGIIAKSRLRKYWEKKGNEQSEPYLNEWYHFCSKQIWHTTQDVKRTFNTASFIANNRVVFNVKGNHYRIICSMDYTRQAMFIQFVGSHKEYDEIKANEVE